VIKNVKSKMTDKLLPTLNMSISKDENVTASSEEKSTAKQFFITEEENYEHPEEFKWTFGKYMLLFELALVIFFNFGSFSILATFFPLEVS